MNNHLERLIKQTVPFASENMKAQLGVLFLSYHYTSAQQKKFKEFNLTLQQYNILRILRGQYPKVVNICLLRERMLDKMSDASRLVHRLFLLGLVSKQTNKLDKRNADIIITDKALEFLQEVDNSDFVKNTLFDNLTQDEVRVFNELIDKMLSSI
jgi:MarR family multiple gene transcriptional regulator MgrA